MVNGTATAAWVRNVGTTLEEHRFRLFYATFANGEWNTATEAAPMRYEGTEGQPALAYHNNRATLIWVRDDDRNYSTATDRRLWLRVLARDGAFEQLDELPTNVVAASLAAKQDGALYIAFTVATSDNLLGAQSDLMVAFQSCTPACTWQTRLLRDGYGRSLRAERALVTVDAQDRATITFRGLGFGPDAQGNLAIYPQDPPGMVQQTGELVQVYFDPNQAVVAPMYLTQDGAVNWQPAALFDNHTNTTLAMAVNVPALGPLQANVSHAAQQTLPAEPLVFGALPAMPDFAVVGSEVDSLYATSKISITLANVGAPWVDSSATPLQLVATWDGGPGVGLPAAAVELTALEEAMTTIVLDLAAPGGLEQPHQLVITANPGQLIPEANGDNNSLTLTLGGLPAPGGLTSASTDGTALVLLSWDASPDARVAGYRIYRATDGGALLPLGSTPVAGYVDVTAEVGPSYQYAVTAYTAMGAESPLDQSEVAAVTIGTATPAFYLPRIMR